MVSYEMGSITRVFNEQGYEMGFITRVFNEQCYEMGFLADKLCVLIQ